MKGKPIREQMEEAIKDLRKIRIRLYRAAVKAGNDSYGLEYENAVGYIDGAIENVRESRLCLTIAEREKKKCEKY